MESDRVLDKGSPYQQETRRQFLRFLLSSPLIPAAGLISLESLWTKSACARDVLSTAPIIDEARPDYDSPFPSVKAPLASFSDATNVFQFKDAARAKLTPRDFYFVESGADDLKTVQANRKGFDDLQIRARRLVDVSSVDTTVSVLGCTMKTPVILAPVGVQQQLHPEGELASARAAASRKCLFTVAMLSSFSTGEIAAEAQGPLWFQLYPGPDRATTRELLERAEAAGSKVLVVTVDGPVRGNREREGWYQTHSKRRTIPRMGNLEKLTGRLRIGDPSLTWDYLDWLRKNTGMKVVIKGIVTREDARLCRKHGADGIIVSNHGGRQEESNRSTIECLPEVVEAVNGRIPVLIDSGFRRGTDIFKALALGARAICIGRPYLWGLASFGEDGVKKVLDLLHAEVKRIMQLAGTPSIKDITPGCVTWRRCHSEQA